MDKVEEPMAPVMGERFWEDSTTVIMPAMVVSFWLFRISRAYKVVCGFRRISGRVWSSTGVL